MGDRPPIPILRYFSDDHLPEPLRAVSAPFGDLANNLADTLPPGSASSWRPRTAAFARHYRRGRTDMDPISQRQARMMMSTYPDRPRPLRAAASRMSGIVGVTGSLVTALAGFGVLTAVQGDAVTGLLGAIPGIITAITTVLAAFGVVRSAEPLVTPLSDPRNDNMQQLLPAADRRLD